MKRVIIILLLFSLSITLKAQSIQRLSAIATGNPWDNQAVGIYDYLTNRAATAIIDISDSTNPILTFQTDGSPDTWSEGIDIVDSIVYVNHNGNVFWIGQAIPPDTIIVLGRYDLPNPGMSPMPWGIEVRDTVLYIACGDRGLYIYNVTDPSNAFEITSYSLPGNLTEFFILDSLIYLANYDSMIILNIKNPASPQYVGAVDIPNPCTDVHVVWPYAYATSYSSFFSGTEGSVKIIDVSDPSNPTIIGSINNIRGDPRAIFVNDDYIYVAAQDWWGLSKNKGEGRADIEGGVRVAQGPITDSITISYDTPGNPREIFVRGNLLLVPDSDSLQILYHDKVGIEEYNKNRPLLSKFTVYPNPAKNIVTCDFHFEKASRITLSVYDELGRKIREIYHGPMIPGNVQFYWDGRDQNHNFVPAGEYFIKISTEDNTFSESQKVLLLK